MIFNASEIAWRLYRKCPYWQSIPEVEIVGERFTIGKIRFVFLDKDVVFLCLITNIDHMEITCNYAIKHFARLINEANRAQT